MNADGKSDEPIVPSTPANNDSAELSGVSAPSDLGEESGSTKRNAKQAALPRTPDRIKRKSRGLHGVREAARKDSKLKFTSLTVTLFGERIAHTAILLTTKLNLMEVGARKHYSSSEFTLVKLSRLPDKYCQPTAIGWSGRPVGSVTGSE